MKKLIVMTVCIAMSVHTMAQVKTATKEDIDRFMKSTTYVVMEDYPFSAFNAYVEEQFAKNWKITPYKMITVEEFDQKCGDPNASFLLVAEARFDETKSSLFRSNTDIFDNMDTYTYDILNLVMGDKSKNINQMADLATVPICYTAVENDETYDYKMGVIISFMQYYVKYCSNNPGKDIRDIQKENEGKMGNYELWILKEELASDVNTVEKIKAVYPYSVKIATREEIQKAINEKNPKVAILHKVGPEGSTQGDSKCWKFIVSVSDGMPLYFSSHKITGDKPDALLEEDLKKLAK
jgi:hypothetical protein